MDFGYVPLAGAFRRHGDQTDEMLFPMHVSFCPTCTLVQIPDVIPKEMLFNEGYHYFSSFTDTLDAHFSEYAQYLARLSSRFLKPTILEFGCNDGILLSKLDALGISCVGIDASANVVSAAKRRNLEVVCGFFDSATVKPFFDARDKPAVITGSNVFAHNDDIATLLEGVCDILASDGYFIVEVHYLPELLQKLQFDFFYHEHCNYYSLQSLQYLLGKYGLEVVDAEELAIHGGSIRVVAQFARGHPSISPNVRSLIEYEKKLNLDKLETYVRFAQIIDDLRTDLLAYLRACRRQGLRICAYGASGRSVTLLNYMGITQEIIEFMIDGSPARANHMMPGLGIPICFPSTPDFAETDVCLITAWSYSDEIMKKEDWYLQQGKQFVIPLPKIEVIRV